MALTANHRIYSPELTDAARARDQMRQMANSVEAALNAQGASQEASLARASEAVVADSRRLVQEELGRSQAALTGRLEANEEAVKGLSSKTPVTLLAGVFGTYTVGANYRGSKSLEASDVAPVVSSLGIPSSGDRRLLGSVLGVVRVPYAVGENYRGTPVGSGASGGDAGPAVSPVDRWVHYGDSLTDWGSPEALAALTGCVHVNAGHASDTSFQVAMRAGGFGYQVRVSGGVIPASGRVELTGHAPQDITTGDSLKYPVTIAGVAGYIQRAGSSAPTVFVRDAAGEPVEAAGWVDVTVDGPAAMVKGRLGNAAGYSLIIGVGRNDLLKRQSGGNVSAVIANIRKIIEANAARVRHVLVWDIPPWSFETAGTNSARYRVEWNAAIATAFPEYFVSITDRLRTDEAFTVAGVSKTEQDVADIENGLTPSSFRRDNAGHFNDAGNRVWAHYMFLEMQKRGFIRGE